MVGQDGDMSKRLRRPNAAIYSGLVLTGLLGAGTFVGLHSTALVLSHGPVRPPGGGTNIVAHGPVRPPGGGTNIVAHGPVRPPGGGTNIVA